MLERIEQQFPVRITQGIIIMIMILLLSALYFVEQPIAISLLNAGQAAHEASGTWTGSIPGLYSILRHIANLIVPCVIVVLLIFWFLRSQRVEWRGEYQR